MARARDDGALDGLEPAARAEAGRPSDAEIASCAGALERAEAELAKARRVIEIQGNVSALLEQLLGTEGAAARSTER